MPDELWQAIELLLPAKRPHVRGGRPWSGDRAVGGEIIYLLRSGVPWRRLPARELSGGSPVTCWRRLRNWQAAEVGEARHVRLLDWPGDDGLIDGSAGRRRQRGGAGEKGGARTRPNPADRGKTGLKYCLLTDAGGRPLAVARSAANVDDSLLREPLVDAVPAVVGPRGRPGRPRRRPAKLHADTDDAYARCRRMRRRRHIAPRIARQGVESRLRLGRHRWVVERTQAWLRGFRRVQVRYERSADLLTGLLHLACALICARSLKPL